MTDFADPDQQYQLFEIDTGNHSMTFSNPAENCQGKSYTTSYQDFESLDSDYKLYSNGICAYNSLTGELNFNTKSNYRGDKKY